MGFVLINKCIISALALATIVIIIIKGRKKTVRFISVILLLVLLSAVLLDVYFRFNIAQIDILNVLSIQIASANSGGNTLRINYYYKFVIIF